MDVASHAQALEEDLCRKGCTPSSSHQHHCGCMGMLQLQCCLASIFVHIPQVKGGRKITCNDSYVFVGREVLLPRTNYSRRGCALSITSSFAAVAPRVLFGCTYTHSHSPALLVLLLKKFVGFFKSKSMFSSSKRGSFLVDCNVVWLTCLI